MNHEIIDAVVREESYYPSLRAALEKVRPCAPTNVTTIDFDALDEIESSGEAFGTIEEFSKLKQGGTKKSTPMVPMPDHCYYSPKLRKLVGKSDAE